MGTENNASTAVVEDEVEEENENSTEKSKEKIGEAVLTSAENMKSRHHGLKYGN